MSSYDRDPEISRYIEKVRAIPKLSREDEHELALRVRKGDAHAADALVQANLRYVVAVALQYRRYGIRLADLIAEGNVGLMIAVRKFDADRGTRFVTYAGYWIRAYILDCVVRSASMVGAGSVCSARSSSSGFGASAPRSPTWSSTRSNAIGCSRSASA